MNKFVLVFCTFYMTACPGSDSLEVVGNALPTPQGVANSPIANKPVSLSFTANTDGCVRTFLMYWRYNSPSNPDGGYSKGNGGNYKIGIRLDDDGAPEKESLDTSYFLPDIKNHPNSDSRNAFRRVEFVGDACLETGTRYHIVLENINADPSNNFL